MALVIGAPIASYSMPPQAHRDFMMSMCLLCITNYYSHSLDCRQDGAALPDTHRHEKRTEVLLNPRHFRRQKPVHQNLGQTISTGWLVQKLVANLPVCRLLA